MMLLKLTFILVVLYKALAQEQFVGSNITEFFSDDIDAGLVSFDPIRVNQTDGVIGLGEGSIAGKFVEDELTGREALLGFAGEDEDFFTDAFQVDPVPPVYSSQQAASDSLAELVDNFEQDILDIFDQN